LQEVAAVVRGIIEVVAVEELVVIEQPQVIL
jgi:hypothetical protein